MSCFFMNEKLEQLCRKSGDLLVRAEAITHCAMKIVHQIFWGPGEVYFRLEKNNEWKYGYPKLRPIRGQ